MNPLTAIPPLARAVIYLTLSVAIVAAQALALARILDPAVAQVVSAGLVTILGTLASANVTKSAGDAKPPVA